MTLNNMNDDTQDSYTDRVVISKPAGLTPVMSCTADLQNQDPETKNVEEFQDHK